MRDDYRFGYFPPGVKLDENVTRRGGADPMGYFPPKKKRPEQPKAPEPMSVEEALESVPVGMCPYCGADFRDKKNPAASCASHIRAKMGDGVHG